MPRESPSSQNRTPLAFPLSHGATSKVNGFPRPRTRLSPGICIGIMKPPRTCTLIFDNGAFKSMYCPTELNLTPDGNSYQTSCGI